MKRYLFLLPALAIALSLTACGSGVGKSVPSSAASSSPAPEDPQSGSISQLPVSESDQDPPGSNILVAYFSWADNAVLDDDVDGVSSPSVIPPGNVQLLAGWVQEETGGDLFAIRVADPYPCGWDACLARANEERGNNTRPELVDQVENLERYDTVFLGYPNWWYGVPMALLTFLEENDLSGKTVYLFCSHGTGGLARSVELITQAAPQANISDNIFDCYEEETTSSEADIKTWVNELHLEGDNSMEQAQTSRQIAVHFDGGTVVYQLNDSPAADALLAQLPLTVEVEDFSTNEKIFYPPQALDTAGTPLAEGGAGVLAYYAPWGDVERFRRQILDADMMVFVTPLYYYGMSTQLKILIDRFCAFNSSIQRKHMKSALLAAAWNSDSWTFEALKSHYKTLVRYLNLTDMGTVLGKGCGSLSMTKHSPYTQRAYELGNRLK